MLHGNSHPGTGRTVSVGSAPRETDIQLAIGGVTAFSTVDCPEHLSCVFYLRGCPFRCPYCHNPELQDFDGPGRSLAWLRDFLTDRQGFIETVVISGGEPLARYSDTDRIAGLARELGFHVALHTTGCRPDRLQQLVDDRSPVWVGLDMKAAPEDYQAASGVATNYFKQMRDSLSLMRAGGVDVEVRSTIYEELAKPDRLERLAAVADELDIRKPVWQVVARSGRVDQDLKSRLGSFLRQRGWTERIELRG